MNKRGAITIIGGTAYIFWKLERGELFNMLFSFIRSAIKKNLEYGATIEESARHRHG